MAFTLGSHDTCRVLPSQHGVYFETCIAPVSSSIVDRLILVMSQPEGACHACQLVWRSVNFPKSILIPAGPGLEGKLIWPWSWSRPISAASPNYPWHIVLQIRLSWLNWCDSERLVGSVLQAMMLMICPTSISCWMRNILRSLKFDVG